MSSKKAALKQQFNDKLSEILENKRDDNNFFISPEEYSNLIKCVKAAKTKKKKETVDYRRLARFDIFAIGSYEKLIKPINNKNSIMRYYVATDELFDVIHDTHILIGHAGRNRMVQELKKKYCNVTKETVMTYLSLCEICQNKKRVQLPLQKIVNPDLDNYLNSRAQIDVIDMQSQQCRDHKFIMVYQDYSTKFVTLKPLRTNTAVEVSNQLLDIFTTFGAPVILQSNNGKTFTSNVIKILHSSWDKIKLVVGKNEGQSEESIDTSQAIQNMLHSWMTTNNTDNWVDGLKFVQFKKNSIFHKEIKCSPHEALFSNKAKQGLYSTPLATENVSTEEEIENLSYGDCDDVIEKEKSEEENEEFEETVSKKIKLY